MNERSEFIQQTRNERSEFIQQTRNERSEFIQQTRRPVATKPRRHRDTRRVVS